MRVLIYICRSSKRRETERQLTSLRSYCSSLGFTLFKEIVDDGIVRDDCSDGFRDVFFHASRRAYDLLLFWSIDNFIREGAARTITYLQELRGYGVEFKSYTELYIDSTGIFNNVLFSLLETFVRQEKAYLSGRVRAGMEKARRKGRMAGRPVLDERLRKKIKLLREKEFSFRRIGRELGISDRTAAKYGC
ncbi:MAG: recombinase family protein [Bacteroidetes bacterium]|nr:recombinase family protein [Bacteroidota bacterium]